MPRQADLKPENFRLTNDPTQQMSTDVNGAGANAKDPAAPAGDLGLVLLQIPIMIAEGLAGIAAGFVSTVFNFGSDVIEAITGIEDGDTGDLGTFVLNIRHGIQATINGIVNAWFGWIGDLWDPDDAADALANQAAAIAGLSASVTALQNNQNNAAVGGITAFIDFTTRAAASSLGADFDQSYVGSGSSANVLGIGSGAEYLVAHHDAPRLCLFEFNALETATDYQKTGIVFGSAPQPGFLSPNAYNEIHGRKNAAGTTYVFGRMGPDQARLGCVVAGAETIFKTTPAGTFNFKPNTAYWLECGTVGGLRIFRLLEGTRPVLVHTEVGTTSQVGASYRRTGGAAYAYATNLGTNKPGRMAAFAMGDNYPPTVVGSGARMYRTSTGTVNVSSGPHQLPANFFSTLAENTADITCDPTNGTFEVSIEGWYDVEFRSAINLLIDGSSPNPYAVAPYPLLIAVWKEDAGSGTPVMDRYLGDVVRGYAYDISAMVSPEAVHVHGSVYLQKGDKVSFGYDAYSSRSDFFTGDAGGRSTYCGIKLGNRSTN